MISEKMLQVLMQLALRADLLAMAICWWISRFVMITRHGELPRIFEKLTPFSLKSTVFIMFNPKWSNSDPTAQRWTKSQAL